MKRSMSVMLLCATLAGPAVAGDGKLIGTAGLNQLEGSGGGGIVPWATLSGYDSDEQTSLNVFTTLVNVDDYRLQVLGASASLYDRVELSVARQTFDLTTLGGDISQTVWGAKVRLYGDVVYSRFPQISAGMQYKDLQDDAIATAFGSADSNSIDYYLAATKVHLGAAGGYNLVWNLTARMTNANQMGLLGAGRAGDDGYDLMLEGSVGVLFNRHFAVGAEYRQKPDNLGLGEDDWWDVFVTYIPSKSFNVTVAWAELGSIAGAAGQNGLYVSVGGQLW
ncbi:DUF3034 family protein [Alteromonas sp. CYL-A6]|uniref:DUF3034 family protein n=1 Tax=Alteromonas nitratireducens TaxID=3390813 RepID=UPI0034ACB457